MSVAAESPGGEGGESPGGGRFAVAAWAAFILLLVAGATFPLARTWGFHFGAYVPWPFAAAVLVLGLALLADSVAARIGVVMEGPARAAVRWKIPAALVAGLIFWLFPIPVQLLGDSFLLAVRITRTVHDSQQYTLGEGNGLLNIPLYVWGGGALVDLFHLHDVRDVFRIYGVVFGAAWVYVVLRYVDVLTRDDQGRVVLRAALLPTAGLILYFRYVEYYMLTFLLWTWFALELYRAVWRRRSLGPAALLAVVAILSHYGAVAMLPALGLAWWLRDRKTTRKRILALWAAGLAAGAVLYAVAQLAGGAGGGRFAALLVPWRAVEGASPDGYTLLGGAHLVDLLNLLVLTAGAAAPMIVIGLRRGSCLQRAEAGWVLWTLLVTITAMTLVHRVTYGLARDWDIYAMLGPVFGLLAFHYRPTSAAAAGRLGGYAALFFVLWAGVHLYEPGATGRFRDLLAQDRGVVSADGTYMGYESLRKWRALEQDYEGATRVLRDMILEHDKGWDYRLFLISATGAPERELVVEDVRAVLEHLGTLDDAALMRPVAKLDQEPAYGDSSMYVADVWYVLGRYFPILTVEELQTWSRRHESLPQGRLSVIARRGAPPQRRALAARTLANYENTRYAYPDRALIVPVVSAYLREFLEGEAGGR